MQHKPKNESSCYRCFSTTQIILLQLNFSKSFWSLQQPIWCELFIFQSSCFVERVATRFIRNAWLSTIGYFDRARSRCKHSACFKTVNMQNKHGSSIRSCDCYLKRCVKNGSTQYSFYVMESRVSNDCTFNIHRPSTPEKRGQPERKHRGKDCQKATDSKVDVCSDSDLGEVPFHYILFCGKENRDLSSKINRVSYNRIS